MRESLIRKILNQTPILTQIDSFPIWQISNSKTHSGQFWLTKNSLLPLPLWVFHEENRQIKLLSHREETKLNQFFSASVSSDSSFISSLSNSSDTFSSKHNTSSFMQKKIYGPFGKGFQLNSVHLKPSLFGEGLFSAPLIFLAQKLIEKSLEPLCFLYKVPPFLRSFFQNLNIEVREWNPEKQEIKQEIKKNNCQNVFISVSNKTLQSLELSLHLEEKPIQVLIAEFQGCGFGACLSCVVLTSKGYRKICSEGPVFYAEI